MNTLTKLWEAHRADRFPKELAGKEINGIDLVLLDADIAGCIMTVIGSAGRIDGGKAEILRECLKDLNNVITGLNDNGKRHYERLKRMAELVLKQGGS